MARTFTRHENAPPGEEANPVYAIDAAHINELQEALEVDDARMDVELNADGSLKNVARPVAGGQYGQVLTKHGTATGDTAWNDPPGVVYPSLLLSPDGSFDANGAVTPTLDASVTVVAGTYGQAWSTGGGAITVPNLDYLGTSGTVIIRASMPAAADPFNTSMFFVNVPNGIQMQRRSTSADLRIYLGGVFIVDDGDILFGTPFAAALTYSPDRARAWLDDTILADVADPAPPDFGTAAFSLASGSGVDVVIESAIFFPVALPVREVERIIALPTAWTMNAVAASPVDLAASDVGLGNVDNTADADKPVSVAQQAALDAKADSTTVDAVRSLAAQGGFANRALRVVGMGDSITDGGSLYQDTDGGIWMNGKASWLTYMAGRSKQRLQVVNNAAVSGDNTNGMLARIATDVIPYTPDLCIVLAGANDISIDIPLATTKANFQAMHEQLADAGIALVLCALTPRDPADPTDPTRLAQTQELSAWLEGYAKTHGLRFIDMYAATVDPDTGGWISGYSVDLLHPGQVAGREMGEQGVTTLLDGFPDAPGVALPVSNVDATNVLSNGLMLTDSTGDGIPDGWYDVGGSVRTLDADATIAGQWSTMTASGVACRSGQAVTTGATGDVYAFMGRVKTSGMEAGGGAWDLSCRWQDASSVAYGPSYYPLGSDVEVDVDDSVFYVEMTPKPAGATRIDVRFNIDAGSGSLSFAQVKLVNLTALGIG